MVQKPFDVAVGSISVYDFGKLEEEGYSMVTCMLTVDGHIYECAEYIESDGDVCDSADAHMDINGIFNVSTGKMEPFVCGGMDATSYESWSSAQNLVIAGMQASLDETPLIVTYDLKWRGVDGKGEFDGDEHDSYSAAEAVLPSFADAILDQIGEDEDNQWVLDGNFVITPFVQRSKKVGVSTVISVADIVNNR